MKIYLYRHAGTPGNREKRYIGRTDEGILPVQVVADGRVARVYTSTRRRTQQTARLLFPNAMQIPCAALDEMCFGAFEGRNFAEMERDEAYRAWVEGGCEGRCPGGESRSEFTKRVLNGFEEIMRRESSAREVYLVVHAGTIRALLSCCAGLDYFGVCVPPLGCVAADYDEGTGRMTVTEEGGA